jgi:hypothetical protein
MKPKTVRNPMRQIVQLYSATWWRWVLPYTKDKQCFHLKDKLGRTQNLYCGKLKRMKLDKGDCGRGSRSGGVQLESREDKNVK